MNRRPCSGLAAVWFVLIMLTGTSVRASGFMGIGFGGELGSVVSANPTAIYYNPGALGFSGTQLMLDLTLAMRETSWTHPASQGDVPEPPGFEGANYGTAHSRLVGGGPQFAASLQLGKHLVVGGGWFVPWGGGSFRFDRNERFATSAYPGAADGVARWHGYEAALRFLYTTAGAAVRFGSISVGATGNVIIGSMASTRALTTSGTNDIAREQRARVEASGIIGSFALGALVEIMPQELWLGVSYQAQPGLGEVTLDGTYTIDATVAVQDTTRTQPMTMHQALPDVIRAGLRYQPLRSFELRLTGSFTRWSLNQTQCIAVRDEPCITNSEGGFAPGSGVIRNLRRSWSDTLGVRAGLSYWPTPSLETFAALGYEPAAVPDATLDPMVADANTISGSLGLRLRLFETWQVAVSYNHQQLLPRDNTGKSRLADPTIGALTRAVDGGGRYSAWFGAANLNIAKSF